MLFLDFNANDPDHPYHAARQRARLPLWKLAHDLRLTGKSYKAIGAALGIKLLAAFKCVTKYESYLLK